MCNLTQEILDGSIIYMAEMIPKIHCKFQEPLPMNLSMYRHGQGKIIQLGSSWYMASFVCIFAELQPLWKLGCGILLHVP